METQQGSIYPLLAWLQDNSLKELPAENDLKRYELTLGGKSLLEEQIKIRDNFRENAGFMVHPFLDWFFNRFPEKKPAKFVCP